MGYISYLIRLIFPCTHTLDFLRIWEYFVTVDHFDAWSKHMVFAKQDGSKLKEIVTQRYATVLVFVSLLLNAEINVLFSPSSFGEEVRAAMAERDWTDPKLMIGIILCISIFSTLFSIIGTVTAWGAVNSVSEVNILFLLRSDIGRIVTGLPFKYITLTLYLFMGWMSLSIGVLMPLKTAIVVLIAASLCFLNIVTHCSAFLNIIMKTGAMREEAMFDELFSKCQPDELDHLLMVKAREKEQERPLNSISLQDSERYDQESSRINQLDRRNPIGQVSARVITERSLEGSIGESSLTQEDG